MGVDATVLPTYCGYVEVSVAVSKLHRRLWERRRQICPLDCPAVHLLHPRHAARVLGYEYVEMPEIAPWPPGGHSNVAGMVDPGRKLIAVSEKYGGECARFTGAHEVGHALLHPGQQFREGPMHGPSHSASPIERQADQFAAMFLMPRRLLLSYLTGTFLQPPPIRVDEYHAFHLDPIGYAELAGATLQRKARAVAVATTNFQGERIVALHQQFGVSATAMAIRLEELKLVA